MAFSENSNYSLSGPRVWKKTNPKVKFLYDEHLENEATTIRVYTIDKDTGALDGEVFKAFFQDDFHMIISNTWNTGDSTIIKTLVDSAAKVITGRSAKMLTSVTSSALDWASKDLKEGDDGYKFANWAKNAVNSAQDYQQSAFLTADDFYKTFKGTNVTFPLSLNLTLVSDEVLPSVNRKTRFDSLDHTSDIYYKLQKILEVSIGDYESVLNDFIGVQKAPNGYKSAGWSIGTENPLEGSLTVLYGDLKKGGFKLTNMLISNIHCTFSKTKVKISPPGEKSELWRPLYIDVQIMLEPGRKFTKDDIYKNLNFNIIEPNIISGFKPKVKNVASKEGAEIELATVRELQSKRDKAVIKELTREDFDTLVEGLDFPEGVDASVHSYSNGSLVVLAEIDPYASPQLYEKAYESLDKLKEAYPSLKRVKIKEGMKAESFFRTPVNNGPSFKPF
jgi:hypothetical protein